MSEGSESPDDISSEPRTSVDVVVEAVSPILATSSRRSSAGHGVERKLRFTALTEVNTSEPPSREGDGHHEDWSRGWTGLTSDPGTPNLSETAAQIRRTLSLASLAQLNNTLINLPRLDSSARLELLASVTTQTRQLVWRGPREPRKLPMDAERALVLAFRRAFRSGGLAWAVRAGVSVMLMLVRSARRRQWKWKLVRHAIFGSEPLRFAAMIGTFTFLNTLTLHLLRLAPPLSYIRRRLLYLLKSFQNGDSLRGSFGPPERYPGRLAVAVGDEEQGPEEYFEEEDTGERRWQAGVAGAVGSLGLLWEDKSRRVGVAQQMFVRGLQASYNSLSLQTGLSIPYGDMLVFGACCGQIMFAFLMSPETIPKEYDDWILSASRAEPAAVPFNRKLVRQGVADIDLLKKAIQNKHITKNNTQELLEIIKRAEEGIAPVALPCAAVHPFLDSCRAVQVDRFFSVLRFMLPVYSALHFIPMLVLRSKHVRKDPLGMLFKASKGTLRSSSFLSVFVIIYQGLLCSRTQALEGYFGRLPNWLAKVLLRKEVFWAIGATCSSLSILIEEKKRRAELAMYVLPKALESAWSVARKRAWVPIVPFGETLMGMAAMAMVMDAYKHEPQALSGIVRRVMYQLIGPP